MATNPCTVRTARLSALWDDADKNRFDPLRGKSGVTPDTYWKTVNNHALQNVGPGTPELNQGDYISLFSRVQNYGAAGTELVDKTKRALEMVDMNSSVYQTRALQILEPLTTPEEWRNLKEVIEQRSGAGLEPGRKMPAVGSQVIQPMNENVRVAAEYMKSLMDHLADIAEKEGILQNRLPNYWPIMYPTTLLENVQFKQMAQGDFALEQARLRMAREQGIKPSAVNVQKSDIQPEDVANAKLIFDRYVIPQYAAVAPHLELARAWDVAGGIEDPKQLIPTYIHQMWRRITEKRVFGERDHLHDFPRLAKEHLGKILAENGNRAHDEALILVKDLVGIHPADPTMHSTIMRTLSNMQGLKLSFSALRNATQQINTAMRGDFESLGKAWYLYLKNGELNGLNVREMALDIGGAADMALYEATLFRSHDRFGNFVEKALRYTGFTPIERLNRIITGISGAIYADKQARLLLEGGKNASKRLLELGIDPAMVKEHGGISTQDMLLSGRRFIDETQFRTRPGDLPFFAQEPIWKFLLQFRTFSINQTRFIIREMQRRPERVLMFALGVMPMGGFAADFIQDSALTMLPWFEPRLREERKPHEAYLESWASAGSFGLLSDFAWATYMAGESKMFSNFFTPPGIGTLNDSVTVMGELARGKGKQAFRDFSRQFGGLGAAFGRYIAPPKSQRDGVSTLDEVEEWLSL